MKNARFLFSLSLMCATLTACHTSLSHTKGNTQHTVTTQAEPISTPNANEQHHNTQSNEQTSNDVESITQTEAEMVATDGLMLAKAYDVPAEIGIKRFMFEHHPDFSEPRDALIANYQNRLIGHGFAENLTHGGHYLLILSAGEQPQDTMIIRKGKTTVKPKNTELNPEHLAIAIQLLENDVRLPIRFIVLNVSQQDYQMALTKIKDPSIFAQLKQKIPNLNRIDFEHDLEKIYVRIEIEKKKGADQARIAKIAKQILGLEIKIHEAEIEHIVSH